MRRLSVTTLGAEMNSSANTSTRPLDLDELTVVVERGLPGTDGVLGDGDGDGGA